MLAPVLLYAPGPRELEEPARSASPTVDPLDDFGTYPSTLASACSSAILICRSSSSRAAFSLSALGSDLSLLYQFTSRPFCHRPVGAMMAWPR